MKFKIIYKVVLLSMAIIMSVGTLLGCGSKGGDVIAPPEPDTQKLESLGEYGNVELAFPAFSDIHFGSVCDTQVRDYYPKALKKSLEVTGNRINAVTVSGDFTEGFLENYDALIGLTIKNVGSKTPLIASYGNHEGDNKHYQYEQKFNKPVDNVTEVNGFNFIAVGAHAGNTYLASQAQWLDTQLKAMTEKDPNKPVFILIHHPVYDTHHQEDFGIKTLRPTLEKYKQAFVLTGHEHEYFNEYSLYKGDFISLRNGFLRNEEKGQYCLIRVTDKNYIVVEKYEIYYGDEEPSKVKNANGKEEDDYVINFGDFLAEKNS